VLNSLSGRETLQARITGYHEAEVVGSQTAKPTIQQTSGSRIVFRSPQRTAANTPRTSSYRTEHQQRKRLYTGIVQANHSLQVTRRPRSPSAARPIQPAAEQFIPTILPARRNVKPNSYASPQRSNR